MVVIQHHSKQNCATVFTYLSKYAFTIHFLIFFRIIDVEFGKIRSKLKTKTLIPEEGPRTIVHVVPDIPMGDSVRQKIFGPNSKDKNEKIRHYVRLPIPTKENEITSGEWELEDQTFDLEGGTFSRLSSLRRSLSFRIRREFHIRVLGETNLPTSATEQKLVLRDKEVEKLRKGLKATYTKSLSKYDKKVKNSTTVQEKREMKLTRYVESLKEVEISKNLEAVKLANSQTQSRVGALTQPTVDRIQDSRTRTAEKSGIRSATRWFNVESERLEIKFQSELKDLKKKWYKDLLVKQADVIRKISKTYTEKRKTAEIVFA